MPGKDGRGSPPLPILVIHKRKEDLVKTIEGLTSEELAVLKVPLESIGIGTATTIADLRRITKICDLLDSNNNYGVLKLEDADYEYLVQRFQSFQTWNPAFRGRIIQVADKLGV